MAKVQMVLIAMCISDPMGLCIVTLLKSDTMCGTIVKGQMQDYDPVSIHF